MHSGLWSPTTFQVKTGGVRQGYLLSPFLSLLAIVWVLKTQPREEN